MKNVSWQPVGLCVAAFFLHGCGSDDADSSFPVSPSNLERIQLSVLNEPTGVISASSVLPIGSHLQYQATAIYNDGSPQQEVTDLVLWNSESSEVAGIDSHGIVTAQAEGDTRISASLNGVTSSTLPLHTSSATLTSLNIEGKSVALIDNPVELKAIAVYSDHTQQDVSDFATWESTTADVMDIDKGYVTPSSAGRFEVMASYRGLSNERSETIIDSSDITDITLDIVNLDTDIPLGSTVQLASVLSIETEEDTVKFIMENHVDYDSDNAAISISDTGLLSADAVAENVTISASTTLYDTTVTDTQVVNVVGAELAPLTLSCDEDTIYLGLLANCKAISHHLLLDTREIVNEDVTALATWSVTNEEILSIEGAGQVKGRAIGSSSVQVEYHGQTRSQEIQVLGAGVASIDVQSDSDSMPASSELPMRAIATMVNDETQDVTPLVNWQVSSEEFATIDHEGTLASSDVEDSEVVTVTAATIDINGTSISDTKDITINGDNNEQIGTLYIPGASISLTTVPLTVKGDVQIVSGTGTLLDGVSLKFLPLTTIKTDSLEITYDDTGTFTFPSDVVALSASPVMSLHTEHVQQFRRPVSITMPYSSDTDIYPIPYAINDDGKLSPVTITAIDQSMHTVTFVTTDSNGSWVLIYTDVYAGENNNVLDTGFLPSDDGFQVTNVGSHTNPGGECMGMSAFSRWYFYEKKQKDGKFFPRFMDTVLGSYIDIFGEEQKIYGQSVIATRSMNAIDQSEIFENDIIIDTSDEERYNNILHELKITQQPILLSMCVLGECGHGHEVLIYKINMMTGEIYIYNSNYPGSLGEIIKYDSGKKDFEPYDGYTEMFATHLPQPKESFENIYNDAKNNFEIEGQPEIIITSHSDREIVDHSIVRLKGSVLSGDTPVKSLKITNTNTGRSVITNVHDSGEFAVWLRLNEGINIFYFTAYNRSLTDDLEAQEITPNNFDISPFHLTLDKESKSSLSMCGEVNDPDPANAANTCLKVASDEAGNWFTSSPSLAVMDVLGYSQDNSKNNSGRTYSGLEQEDGDHGPSGGEFARFRQDGKNAQPDNGVGGQFYRWCQTLASLNFSGRTNWRRPTKTELAGLYNQYSDIKTGLWAVLGWPTDFSYWSKTPEEDASYSSFYYVSLHHGDSDLSIYAEQGNYASCISSN